MKAVLFRYSMVRLAFARVFGLITPRAYVSRGSPLSFEDIAEPEFHADDWVIVRTRLCGVCGSDTKQVFLEGAFDNPLTGMITFPQVLGHEAVGVIEQVGPGVAKRRVGERVVLNPWLSCAPRGIEPLCDACQHGEYYLCKHFLDGNLPPGMHIGNCSAATGGYAPLFAAHESQLFPIPDSVSFDQAVFADPFSVSLHAVLKAPPIEDGLALVYGCGTLGLLTIPILRTFYPSTQVIVIARYKHQVDMARRMGAQHIIRTRQPVEIIETIAEMVGTRVYRPWHGKPMLLRGVDVIYDTVGSAETFEVGMRVAGPHAKYVVTGVAIPARFEWTPHYFKEIEFVGSNAFGIETFQGLRLHAMEIYLRLLEEGELSLPELITHRYRLEQYQAAFLATHDKEKSGAIKAVIDYDLKE